MFDKILNAFVRRKPVHYLGTTETKLNRCLSTFDLTFFGVSSTIGTGIYVLAGEVAKNLAGPGIVISFLIAAFASLLSGFCYSELGVRFPRSGSAYSYCYIAIGEVCAFVIGWIMLLEYIIGVASTAKAASNYIDAISNATISTAIINIFGEMHISVLGKYFDAFAALLIVFITIVSCFGIKTSAVVNGLVALVNITTLSIVMIGGLTKANIDNWIPFAPYGFNGILQGSSTCFFAFIGFDTIMTTSEESKTPGKSIPLSIFYTVAISLILYVGVSVVLTLMLPYYKLDVNHVFSAAFEYYHMYTFVYVVSTGAVLALLGGIVAGSVAPVRMIYAMALDGLFPSRFAHVSERGVPIYGVLIAGVLNLLLASFFDLKSLANMMSIGTLLAYSIVDISVLILRYQLPTDMEAEEMKDINSIKNRLAKARKSQTVIYTIIFILIIGSFIASILAGLLSKQIFVECNPLLILLFVVTLILILTCGLFLNAVKQTIPKVSFVTPLVPWVPMIALLCNFTLMMKLPSLTWIRLGIWGAVGLLIYFGYSIHFSVEGNGVLTDYTQVQQTDDKETLDVFREEGKK